MAIIGALHLNSCRNNLLHEYLTGTWVIDSINYEGHNIKRCLLVNSVSFEEDNSLFLPDADFLCTKFKDRVHTGTFKTEEISKDSAIIDFDTDNHFFRGRHLLVKRDSSKYIMEIKSDSLFILLLKIGYQ